MDLASNEGIVLTAALTSASFRAHTGAAISAECMHRLCDDTSPAEQLQL